MGLFLISALVIWLTAWIAWQACNYNYDKRVRPHVNGYIYRLQAHWELLNINAAIRARKLKERDEVEVCEIEEVRENENAPLEWTVDNTKRLGETIVSTELIINE